MACSSVGGLTDCVHSSAGPPRGPAPLLPIHSWGRPGALGASILGFFDPDNNPGIMGGVNENVFEDSVAPAHAAGQVQLWEGSHTIDADLRLEAAPGHTPGSGVVKLASGD